MECKVRANHTWYSSHMACDEEAHFDMELVDASAQYTLIGFFFAPKMLTERPPPPESERPGTDSTTFKNNNKFCENSLYLKLYPVNFIW
jgi:hypothetical protein